MNPQHYLHVVMPIFFIVLSAFFLVVGGRPILQNRPFLMSSRILFCLLIVAFSPSFLNSLVLSHGGKTQGGLNLLMWMNPLMLGFILFMFWYQLRGYIAYGITQNSFRDALLHSLKKMDLPHEEKLSSLFLTSVDVDLQVSIQGWMGTAMLKAGKNNQPGLLRSIACEMNSYFASHTVGTNKIGCYFYCVLGLFMLAFAVIMIFLK